MKSRIDKCTGAFATDREWYRLVLDKEELFKALDEEGVSHLVREVLRPEYGRSPIFHAIVADLTKDIMSAVVAKLRGCTKEHPAVVALFEKTKIEKAEKMQRQSVKNSQFLGYWVGEITPIQENW